MSNVAGAVKSIVLSDQQKAIIAWFEGGTGNAVFRARAGCGKTFTALAGINVAPESRAVFLAFNKSIAEENAAKNKNANCEVKTLHSLSYGFMRRQWRTVRPDFKRGETIAKNVIGSAAPFAIVKGIAKIASLLKGIAPLNTTINDATDIALDFDIGPSADDESAGYTLDRMCAAAVKCLDLACLDDGTCDFDDMIFVPLRMGWLRPTYDLVVVDECQDMNAAQILTARRVVKPSGRIAVVGDDRQAIYGFRGADSGSLDRLLSELNAIEMPLTITRRCPKAVVALAANLVPDFVAADDAPQGAVNTIGPDAMFKDAKPGDFILSRKNAPLASIALRFLREGRAARVEGKDIGAGLVAMVRKVAGKSNLGIVAFLSKLDTYASKQIAKLTAANGPNQTARIAYVNDQVETIAAIAEGKDSLATLISAIEDLFDVKTKGDPKPAIVCSSVHKAKGKESPTVYVLTDTLYPGGRHTAEEDNIAYVAYTRAMSTLNLVVGIG